MAVLIEGLQGSGKSYYATYKMLHDGEKYNKILTNIDGIKKTEKISSLQFKSFTKDILDECYAIQVEKDGSFEESISFLQKMHVLPMNVSTENRILLVVDEAQNYFGKSVKLNPSLVWFITQHRHLYIELYLITQKYTLLRPDYHLFNLIIKAYPPIKQFSKKSIRYREYAGLPMSDENLSRKFSLPKEEEVFSLYISGDKVDSPSILKKFLVYFVFIAVFIAGLVYFFTQQFGDSPNPVEKIKVGDIQSFPSSRQEKKEEELEDSSTALYTFVVSDDGYFHIRGVENESEYPVRLLTYLQKKYFRTVIEKIDMGYGITFIYVLCDRDMIEILNSKKETTFTSTSSYYPSD